MDHPATDFSEESIAETREKYLPLTDLPPDRFMRAFFAGGVEPAAESEAEADPDPAPQPEWIANRPAGLQALIRAIAGSHVPVGRLSSFAGPAYFLYGELSEGAYEPMRDRLASRFPNFESEVYAGASEWEPATATCPDRLAAALRRLWTTAEERSRV